MPHTAHTSTLPPPRIFLHGIDAGGFLRVLFAYSTRAFTFGAFTDERQSQPRCPSQLIDIPG